LRTSIIPDINHALAFRPAKKQPCDAGETPALSVFHAKRVFFFCIAMTEASQAFRGGILYRRFSNFDVRPRSAGFPTGVGFFMMKQEDR
jgi:hypothetical protein